MRIRFARELWGLAIVVGAIVALSSSGALKAQQAKILYADRARADGHDDGLVDPGEPRREHRADTAANQDRSR